MIYTNSTGLFYNWGLGEMVVFWIYKIRSVLTSLASTKYWNKEELQYGTRNSEFYYKSILLKNKLKIDLEYFNNKSF